jgi:hypothetical protein
VRGIGQAVESPIGQPQADRTTNEPKWRWKHWKRVFNKKAGKWRQKMNKYRVVTWIRRFNGKSEKAAERGHQEAQELFARHFVYEICLLYSYIKGFGGELARDFFGTSRSYEDTGLKMTLDVNPEQRRATRSGNAHDGRILVDRTTRPFQQTMRAQIRQMLELGLLPENWEFTPQGCMATNENNQLPGYLEETKSARIEMHRFIEDIFTYWNGQGGFPKEYYGRLFGQSSFIVASEIAKDTTISLAVNLETRVRLYLRTFTDDEKAIEYVATVALGREVAYARQV